VTLLPYDSSGEVVSGVTLDLNYANVLINIGKAQSTEVNVEVEGFPMEGYEVVSVNVNPSQVVLTGPVDIMRSLTSVMAEGIVLDGDENTTFIVEKDLMLPAGVSIQGLTGPIQIEIRIEQIQSKEFVFSVFDLPIVNLDDAFKLTIVDEEIPIIVKISDVESIITPLSKNEIQMDLNLSNVDKPGVYKLKVNFANLESYKEVVIDPVYVEVNVVENEE
jgi:YbbR domain-containing protein